MRDKAITAIVLGFGVIFLCLWELWVICAFYFTFLRPLHPWVSVALEKSSLQGVISQGVNLYMIMGGQ
jgi:hypothetical protein